MRPFMFSSAAEDQPRDTWQKMQLFASAPTVRCRWRNILATMYGLYRLLRDASCMDKRCEIVLEGGTKDRNSLAVLQHLIVCRKRKRMTGVHQRNRGDR